MKKNKLPDIRLVITAALKKEIPKEWLKHQGIPVHTLSAVRSGAFKDCTSGMLVLITGAGLKASEEAARWIRDNLDPFFVLNIGTCGITDRRRSTGRWLMPRYVSNEAGDTIELDDRLPLPFPEKAVEITSLLSVKKPVMQLPAQWKGHDTIDMECFAQAEIFDKTETTFHCLKFGTDYSDRNTDTDFQKNLALFTEEIKKLFSPLIPPLPRGDKGGVPGGGTGSSNITAIIPVHNREHTIERAVDSVLEQTLPPEEIIVVDDASTDRTKEILKGYGDRITLISLKENSGPSKARNAGIKRARTEWIAFLDSDDLWQKDKLQRQAGYLRKYPFYQIMQSEEIWIRNGRRVNPCRHHKKPEGWIWEESLQRCLVSPSAVLLKKSLLWQYGNFDEDLSVCEDYDLWLKISRHHPVGLEPSLSVTKYGGHRDQLSRRYPAMDMFRVRSLYRILMNEPSTSFRGKAVKVLENKLNILINGYRKRDRDRELQECEKILGSLAEYIQ